MIRVCLNCYGNYTTDSVYQWDQNQTLRITGENVDEITAIHFCNKKCDTAIVVGVARNDEEIIAQIPNSLLEEPYDVIAYVHTIDDNQAKTIEIISIPVIKRVKPDDYIFVENVEIVNFERLESDILTFFANTNDLLEEYREEMDSTLQDCRDTVSIVQLEVVNIDGGYPTTGTYEDTFDGGYPT